MHVVRVGSSPHREGDRGSLLAVDGSELGRHAGARRVDEDVPVLGPAQDRRHRGQSLVGLGQELVGTVAGVLAGDHHDATIHGDVDRWAEPWPEVGRPQGDPVLDEAFGGEQPAPLAADERLLGARGHRTREGAPQLDVLDHRWAQRHGPLRDPERVHHAEVLGVVPQLRQRELREVVVESHALSAPVMSSRPTHSTRIRTGED